MADMALVALTVVFFAAVALVARRADRPSALPADLPSAPSAERPAAPGGAPAAARPGERS
ncbi:hypothetical protein OMK64_03795 [Cellulomonas fimi]|uniref:hypothetical protein n=1 Tax=Cellulomonas fimi TaxID=1708 RepID=UPI00234DEDCC|nr:hypothetical protein [Cellulomonas fimi]MDC7120654.1 hypothetical protein [Cellulomonas fimi]